jgi:hypothetical protein
VEKSRRGSLVSTQTERARGRERGRGEWGAVEGGGGSTQHPERGGGGRLENNFVRVACQDEPNPWWHDLRHERDECFDAFLVVATL